MFGLAAHWPSLLTVTCRILDAGALCVYPCCSTPVVFIMTQADEVYGLFLC